MAKPIVCRNFAKCKVTKAAQRQQCSCFGQVITGHSAQGQAGANPRVRGGPCPCSLQIPADLPDSASWEAFAFA